MLKKSIIKQFVGLAVVLGVFISFSIYGLVTAGMNVVTITKDVLADESTTATADGAETLILTPSITPVIDKTKLEPTPSEVVVPVSEGLIPDGFRAPTINIALPVRYVPLENETWKVNDAAANYAGGTDLINSESGNVGLFGHDRDNAFHSIKNLKVGDPVILVADEYTARYRVTESFNTIPQDVDVFAKTEVPTVTLVTCSGSFSQMRYVVRAQLDYIELNNNE